MQKIIRAIEAWIKRLDFEDPEKNLSSLYIHVISFLVIASSFLLGGVYLLNNQLNYFYFISLEILVYCLVIVLLRFRKLHIASTVFLISALVLLSLGIFSVGGIHATSSVMYPVILVFASLLLDRKNFIIYSLLCVVSVALIVYAENQGLGPVPYVPDPPSFSLFISYAMIIGTSGVIIRSITESLQNNTQKAHQYAQKLYTQKAMLDRVGQAVVACQLDNTIIYWNQAATELYGWSEADALDRKYFDLVPSDLNPKTTEDIRIALRKGEVWSGEMKIQKRDHSSTTILGTVSPIQDVHGTVTGWIGVATDLTEQKKVEQVDKRRVEEMKLLNQLGISVASGRDLYSTLLALQTEIVKLIQADAFYVAIYDEKKDIVRYPVFFDEGSPMDEAPRLLHEWPGLTGAVIFGKETLYLPDIMTTEVEEKYHPHDDNALILHTFLGIPLIVNKNVIGMLSVQSKQIDAYSPDQIQLMENIAIQAAIAIGKASLMDQLKQELGERKKLIGELEKKNTELERFTYTVSHDLKSPLVTINGFLGYLDQDFSSGNKERFKRDLQRIHESVAKMQRLLGELLELSRIGRLMNPPEQISFEDLVHEARDILQGRLTEKQVAVHVQPNLPMVFGDKPRLVEVLQNLIDNAAKYMGDQPRPVIEIGLSGYDEPKHPIFFVRDNGLGIAPEYHDRIFGLFNKLDPMSEGTGVGLAIVKRIVEVHGGRIWVESNGKGTGSTFCFTLAEA